MPDPVDFDQVPTGQQIVNNWGEPTGEFQALWQRLTTKVGTEIGRVDQNVTDVGAAASAAASAASAASAAAATATSAATAASAAATLATTASGQATTAAGLATTASGQAVTASGQALDAQGDIVNILSYLLDAKDYQDDLNAYITKILTNFLYLVTILDDVTQPLSPAVDSSMFPFPSIGSPPTPPTPPT